MKKMVYEYIISKEEIRELENVGLTKNQIILFADDKMSRYFNPEYVELAGLVYTSTNLSL